MRLRPAFPWMLAVSLLFAAEAAPAAPRAELWPRWLAHDRASVLGVDHAEWGRFLAKHLVPGADGVNRLRYGGVAPGERKALAGYVERLAGTPVGLLGRPEQLAYWINLYNALTVLVILDHYPVNTILRINISPGWFAVGPWGKKLVRVEGEALSLDDIEHRILRPIWRDPRIHYAVNCASIGCPNLAAEPFTAASADAMLTEAARAYVNHPRGVRITEHGPVVSSIYHWYAEDFGGNDAEVLAHLRRYASPALAARLAGFTRVADHAYDWDLNEAPAP